MFGWRGFHEILPTIKGLKRRNISAHSNCPLCGFGEDSNAHAIFWCPFAQELWVLVEFSFLVGQKEEISFKEVLLYATEFLDEEGFAKMLINAWGIWSERNKKTHDQQNRTPQQLKSRLASYYAEIKKAQAHEGGASGGEEATDGRQSEIDINELALFVDASVSTTDEMVDLGAIIFTTNKRSKAALSKPLKGSLSVFHAETLALLVGLRWAQNIGLPIKTILSDSLSLVQALNNTNVYHNELGILISDIKMILANFPGAVISHVNRKFNCAAHNLAKQALQLDSELSWVEEFPQNTENSI